MRMKSSNEKSSACQTVAELLLHPVAVGKRIPALLDRPLVDVLRVLVVAHQEAFEAAEPLVARDDVGGDLLVGVPRCGRLLT